MSDISLARTGSAALMNVHKDSGDYVQRGLVMQYDIIGGQLLSNTTFVTCAEHRQTLWTCEILVLPNPTVGKVVKWASNNYPTLYGTNGYPVNAIYTGSRYYSGYNRSPFKTGGTWSDANVSFGDMTGHYYKNGVKVGEYSIPSGATWANDSHTVDVTASGGLIAYVASVRVYSRALSPDEIYRNYTIDCIRFGFI